MRFIFKWDWYFEIYVNEITLNIYKWDLYLIFKCWYFELEQKKKGNKKARKWIAMIKSGVPQACQRIIDRAIQIFGAEGLSSDIMLSKAFVAARSLRIADGPDEVHNMTVALSELRSKM